MSWRQKDMRDLAGSEQLKTESSGENLRRPMSKSEYHELKEEKVASRLALLVKTYCENLI